MAGRVKKWPQCKRCGYTYFSEDHCCAARFNPKKVRVVSPRMPASASYRWVTNA